MKHLTLFLFALFISFTLTAQEKTEVRKLIEEGIKLHDTAKYEEAISKYKEALTLEPDNTDANYEIALTYFNTTAKKDAIPYLQKIVQTKNSSTVMAYDMLGSIYDIDNKPDQAIEFFNRGIKADPTYQRIYFNLAITYARQGKSAEAELNTSIALKLDPGHASSHRLYAIVAAGEQGNKIKAVLAYCNFLLLEATTPRSATAYKDLKALLGAGVSEKDGVNNITLGGNSADKDINAANMAIPLSLLSAKAIPNLGDADQLELQLKTIFNITGELAAKKTDKDFFWSYYPIYFAKLAKTEFMPVAAHIISFSANPEENKKWISEHSQELEGFLKWQNKNPRK